MRYRRREWDVPMPDALLAYWTAWNEPDVARIARHLSRAVVEDVEWNDPRDSFVGVDELERAVRRLRTRDVEWRPVHLAPPFPQSIANVSSAADDRHYRVRHKGRSAMPSAPDVAVVPSGVIERPTDASGRPLFVWRDAHLLGPRHCASLARC